MSTTSAFTLPQALQGAASALQRGDVAAAERWCRTALDLNAACFDALNMLGVIAAGAGRMEEAAGLLGRAVAVNPRSADTFSNLAAIQAALNRYSEALESCNRAIALRSGFVEAHFNRGVALAGLGRNDEALASYDRAAGLRPEDARVHNNRGNVLHALARDADALVAFEHALALQPGYADALVNRGTALRGLGRNEEALASVERALALDPRSAGAHNNRGVALQELRRFGEALESYDRAIALSPGYAEAHYNCGNALRNMGRPLDAIASYERALVLQPDYADAWHASGYAAGDLFKHDVALTACDRAMRIAPDRPYLRGDRLHARMQVCHWDGFAAEVATLRECAANGERALSPGAAIGLFDDPALQRRIAEAWTADKFAILRDVAGVRVHAPHPKIRIGYFSADFHEHATMHLMAELFERHDRARFEFTAFSFGPDRDDGMRRRAVAGFDRFVDVREKSDRDVALLARELGIDIAVDLKGHTQHSRAAIFAQRAAPIQVNYLGYPGTMGAAFIDYIIADPTLIADGDEQYYDERVALLPDSYQPNDRSRPIADREPTRGELGLPAAGFVYCCFNATYKITPETFDSWMRILARVDGSVLWLLEDSALASSNLRREADKRGIVASRIAFAPRAPFAPHLARQRAADLFLDTLPCNAHTTASDALWAGLPVLTRAGRTFAGRVGASLVRAAGLPELVVDSAERYEQLAVDLARDRQRLDSLRRRLVASLPTAPLFDAARIARYLEAAYVRMYERHRGGQAPEHFRVPA